MKPNIALSNIQIAFVVIVPIVVLAMVVFLVVIPLIKKGRLKNYRQYYYKTIRKIALYGDYYLINNFEFELTKQKTIKIDHILFADKFIYLINTYNFDGDLIGDATDASLVLINQSGRRDYIDENPYITMQYVLSKLSAFTGLPANMMVGIALCNDKIKIAVKSNNKQYYLIQRNNLEELIAAIEKRDVAPINEDELHHAVQALNSLNLRKE